MKKFTILFSLFVFLTVQLIKAQVPADTIGAGNTLQFSGVQQSHIELGNPYQSLTFPFSVQAWINPATIPAGVGGIFATCNDATAYYGVTVTQRSTGQLGVSFGDGVGLSSPNRRGFVTNNLLPLNQWTQITVVCNSTSDVSMYLNGILQNITADNGTSSITTLTNDPAGHTNIGEQWNVTTYEPFDGQIDEVRLWNIALTLTQVQNTMCQKISPGTSGLLGYWRADESATNDTVYDYTSNHANGTVTGTVTREISDAPIGNNSSYLYASAYDNAQLWVNAATGDTLYAGQITGDPDGVQIYAVNSKPFDTAGLQFIPDNYFGVFCVNGTSPGYNVTYHYSLTNGAVNSSNEDLAALESRTDASVGSWSPLDGLLNTYYQRISKRSQSSPQEFILNDTQMETGIEQLSINNNQLSVYPNPTDGEINVISTETIDELKVFNLLGQLVYESQPKQTQFTFELKDEGMYFVTVTADGETTTRKVLVSR